MGSWLAKPVHPVPLTNVPGSATNNNVPRNNNNVPRNNNNVPRNNKVPRNKNVTDPIKYNGQN